MNNKKFIYSKVRVCLKLTRFVVCVLSFTCVTLRNCPHTRADNKLTVFTSPHPIQIHPNRFRFFRLLYRKHRIGLLCIATRRGGRSQLMKLSESKQQMPLIICMVIIQIMSCICILKGHMRVTDVNQNKILMGLLLLNISQVSNSVHISCSADMDFTYIKFTEMLIDDHHEHIYINRNISSTNNARKSHRCSTSYEFQKTRLICLP